MTVKNVLQKASTRLIGQKLDTFFSSSDTFEIELTDLLNDVAEDLRKAHDWQFITALATITGDGTTEAHTLPTNYDRHILDGKVWDPSWPALNFLKSPSIDAYYLEKTVNTAGAPGWWIMIGGAMNIWPVLEDARQAQYYYITKKVGVDSEGEDITVFSADSDVPIFDERLMALGVIWKHKAQKGNEYAEDLANYQKALSDEIKNDKAASVIRVGGNRMRNAVGTAYPGTVTP